MFFFPYFNKLVLPILKVTYYPIINNILNPFTYNIITSTIE